MTHGPIRRGPSGDFLEGENANDVPLWDPVAKDWTTGAIPGGGGVPFSNVFYVDLATTVDPADQNGSAIAPFDTIQAALDANPALLSSGLTLYICPGDYSAETLAIGSNNSLQFWGLTYTGPGIGRTDDRSVKLGEINMTLGGEQGQLAFVNIEFGGAQNFCAEVKCINCKNVNVTPGTDGIDPAYCSLTVVGGLFQGAVCAFLALCGQDLQVGPAPGSVTIHEGTLVRVQGADLAGSACAVEFIDDPGTVYFDLYTEQTGPAPPFTVTNGVARRFALPVQDITASLADQQAQIDNIVAAGVTLGFWTDNRVP